MAYKNNHYVPQLILRRFGERLCTKNIKSGEFKTQQDILLDRNMKKKDLQKKAQLAQYQMYKLGKGEAVTTDIIGKICVALDVKTDDIMEFIPDEPHDDFAE